jgi:hypothetical protein
MLLHFENPTFICARFVQTLTNFEQFLSQGYLYLSHMAEWLQMLQYIQHVCV